MSRNTESRFSLNPTNIDMPRSTFYRNSSHKTSFNVGSIIPFYIDEVVAGDSFNISTSKICRLQSLITAPMDNMYIDTYYFFVPNRLIWEHWKEFMGENTQSAWLPTTTYSVPQITSPAGGWEVGSLADYFGIPTGVENLSVNALPFRAYALVMNEWFRDQNLSDPLYIPVDDSTIEGSNGSTFVSDVVKGGKPYLAAKYHDYFTSALPSPQKGPDVSIAGLAGDAHVFGNGYNLGLGVTAQSAGASQLTFGLGHPVGSSYPDFSPNVYGNVSGVAVPGAATASMSSGGTIGVVTKATAGDHPEYTGLVADLASGLNISINSLRYAFQLQKLYEKDARGGTRYRELLKSHFGVTSPDARMQVPEYLGGNRCPININQVVQTSSTAVTPQGNVAGYSVTADRHSDFTRSFTEHGLIIGVCCVRYDHTYQNGIERLWSRKDRFDYYWPVLANIGEQPILNKEIFAQGDQVIGSTGKPVDEEVFGYQEAWADYRYKPSRVSGEMRSTYATSLDSWHLADDYTSLPYLSDSWIREDKSNVDRVLAVQSSVSNQIFADFYVQNKTTRCMPLYSIPGLIDHH